MPWNPEVYSTFKSERFAPFEDLMQLIQIRPDLKVVDLGCGTGELTLRLHQHLPGSSVVGIDSSSEMLQRAAKLEQPDLRFELTRIEQVQGTWDLIFSHAAIHWVGDHNGLLKRLFSMVRRDGQLVVQLPSNYNHPVMKTIRDIAAKEPFATGLGGWIQPVNVLPLAEYAELLYRIGGKNLNVFEKVYPYVMKDSDALVDWTSGTALVPYMEKLPENLQQEFIAMYRATLKRLYPESPVFFGFSRILFSADR